MIIKRATSRLSLEMSLPWIWLHRLRSNQLTTAQEARVDRKMLQHETGSSSSEVMTSAFSSFSTCSFVCKSWTGCHARWRVFTVFCTSAKRRRSRSAVWPPSRVPWWVFVLHLTQGFKFELNYLLMCISQQPQMILKISSSRILMKNFW